MISKIFLSILFSTTSFILWAQTGKLIYPPSIFKKCQAWADSVQNIYYQQDTPSYQAIPQAIGYSISYSIKNAKEKKAILEELDQQIFLLNFQEKYRVAVEKDEFILPYLKTNPEGQIYWKEDSLEFVSTGKASNPNSSIHWYYNLTGRQLKAYYFPKGIEQPTLPATYAYWVGYVDALVDPTVPRLLPYGEHTEERFGRLSSELSRGWSYWSKNRLNNLLEEWRNLRIKRDCGMDKRPLRYAVELAQIAAAAERWDIFLRAHLYVLEERYQVPCKECPQTHMMELEALNIDVPALLLGSLLSIQSKHSHHYFKDHQKLAKALKEAKDKEYILEQVLTMIQEEQLDTYNRYKAAHLYLEYLLEKRHIEDNKANFLEEVKTLKKAIATLPGNLHRNFGFHLMMLSYTY